MCEPCTSCVNHVYIMCTLSDVRTVYIGISDTYIRTLSVHHVRIISGNTNTAHLRIWLLALARLDSHLQYRNECLSTSTYIRITYYVQIMCTSHVNNVYIMCTLSGVCIYRYIYTYMWYIH